jgi:hypothetical protein
MAVAGSAVAGSEVGAGAGGLVEEGLGAAEMAVAGSAVGAGAEG